MIVVSGVIELGSKDREAAIEAAKKMAEASRSEDGCISYSFYIDIENPNMIRVFEEWSSDEALATHFDAPHMTEFREALRQIELKSRAVKHYTVSKVGDL